MSTLSIPYTFSSGYAYSAQVNANFTAIQTAVNNITAASSGVYASDVSAGNTGQATFGGSQTYEFLNGIIVAGSSTFAGPLTTSAIVASSLYTGIGVYPVGGWLTSNGSALGSTPKTVIGSVSFSAQTSVTVTLTNAAVFTNSGSWVVTACGQGTTQQFYAYVSSGGSAFIIATSNAASFTGSVNWIARGY